MMATMSARRAPQSTGIRRWSLLLVAGAVVSLAGCSWRLETAPVVYASPSEITLQRDGAAVRESHIIDALAGGASFTDSALASLEATAAPRHLDALGGVYLAYPSPTPSASAEPFLGSLEAAVTQARDGALASAQATTDEGLSLLESSIGLTHAFALWWDADGLAASAAASAALAPTPDADGQASPPPVVITAVERILPTSVDLGTSFVPSAPTTQLPSKVLSDLAVAHDRARFLYEVMAAKASGAERANALARRDIHAARSDALAALSDQPDRREVLYYVPPKKVATAPARGATATTTEFALGSTYMSLLDGAAVKDRGWLLNAAFDAYAAGAIQAGFTVAQFPTLPGIETVP